MADYSMNSKLFSEHHLEFLSIKGGCIGSSESTLNKMPHCWKLNVTALIIWSSTRTAADVKQRYIVQNGAFYFAV